MKVVNKAGDSSRTTQQTAIVVRGRIYDRQKSGRKREKEDRAARTSNGNAVAVRAETRISNEASCPTLSARRHGHPSCENAPQSPERRPCCRT